MRSVNRAHAEKFSRIDALVQRIEMADNIKANCDANLCCEFFFRLRILQTTDSKREKRTKHNANLNETTVLFYTPISISTKH